MSGLRRADRTRLMHGGQAWCAALRNKGTKRTLNVVNPIG